MIAQVKMRSFYKIMKLCICKVVNLNMAWLVCLYLQGVLDCTSDKLVYFALKPDGAITHDACNYQTLLSLQHQAVPYITHWLQPASTASILTQSDCSIIAPYSIHHHLTVPHSLGIRHFFRSHFLSRPKIFPG